MMEISKSLKRNTVANYVGIGYATITGIVILPFYLQYLGAEAYGLVGFFALMQAWLNLLDMGLSPTLARQVAYARGRDRGFDDFIKLLRSFEIIFLILATLVAIFIILSSDWISRNWINAEVLDSGTIAYSISIMGALIGLRFFASLYRSGINGMEDQVWLNAANISIVSLKFIGSLLFLHFISTEIIHFFEYQLLVGILEVIILIIRLYKILPVVCDGYGFKFSLKSVRSIAPFALSIAYTAGIWIVLMQLDKLLLSGILSLSEFGYFTIVGLAASGLIQLFMPVMSALLPRMTVMVAEGKAEEMISMYRKATQFVSVVVISAALVMAVFGYQLLYAWTGDSEAADWGQDVLFWFVLGNAVVALSSFQYNLQNAYGDLKLHVKGSTISAVLQIPVIYYAATRYGAIGAGIAWFGFRFIWFLWWTPIVHCKFAPNLHLRWLFVDIVPIIAAGLVAVYIINVTFNITNESRLGIAFDLIMFFLIMIGLTSLGSSRVVKWVFDKCC